MIRTIDEYYKRLYDLYPNIPKEDIRRIVNYGWRQFYWFNLRGCDVQVKSRKIGLWMQCGRMYYNSREHFRHYKNKLQNKIRALFKRQKDGWDGYYYTYITEEEYQKIRNLKNFKVTLQNRKVFKIDKECYLYHNMYTHFIKFKYENIGFVMTFDNLECNAEIAKIKDHPLNMQDLIDNNI